MKRGLNISETSISNAQLCRRLRISLTRTRIVGGLAMLVVFGGLIEILHYQPIATNPDAISTNFLLTSNGSLAAREPGTRVPSWIMPSGGSVLVVAATIINRGPIGVWITGVGAPIPFFTASSGGKQWLKVRTGKSMSWKLDAPLKSIALGSHSSTKVLVEEGYPCIPRPGNGWTISILPVTTRFLGVTHVVNVQIQPFDLVLPSSC